MHHKLVIRTAAILALLTAGAGAAQTRQDDESILAAVDAVIGFRRGPMGDTLMFDACTVFTAARRPERFPDGIGQANRPALDRPGPRPCDFTEQPARLPYRVYVDSLVLSDSVGSMYLTVRRGEWLHREMFVLPRLRGGRWGVREVRIWGAIQIMPPPPRRSGIR